MSTTYPYPSHILSPCIWSKTPHLHKKFNPSPHLVTCTSPHLNAMLQKGFVVDFLDQLLHHWLQTWCNHQFVQPFHRSFLESTMHFMNNIVIYLTLYVDKVWAWSTLIQLHGWSPDVRDLPPKSLVNNYVPLSFSSTIPTTTYCFARFVPTLCIIPTYYNLPWWWPCHDYVILWLFPTNYIVLNGINVITFLPTSIGEVW